jgi:hypothetical protein
MAASQTQPAEVDTVAQVIEAIKKNGDSIDWGLGRRLVYHADKVPLPTGIADLLLITDDRSTLYVVEILPGECSAEDVGRLLGHCGWLQTAILSLSSSVTGVLYPKTENQHSFAVQVTEVKGILLAAGFNAGALCAVANCAELIAMTYSFSIRLGKP